MLVLPSKYIRLIIIIYKTYLFHKKKSNQVFVIVIAVTTVLSGRRRNDIRRRGRGGIQMLRLVYSKQKSFTLRYNFEWSKPCHIFIFDGIVYMTRFCNIKSIFVPFTIRMAQISKVLIAVHWTIILLLCGNTRSYWKFVIYIYAHVYRFLFT